MNPHVIACLLALGLGGCPNTAERPSATGGSDGGGSGPCAVDEMPVQQLVSTEVECELSGLPTQCAETCDLHCADNEFDLGAVGSGCAMEEENKAFCRCVCAYCRPS